MLTLFVTDDGEHYKRTGSLIKITQFSLCVIGSNNPIHIPFNSTS